MHFIPCFCLECEFSLWIWCEIYKFKISASLYATSYKFDILAINKLSDLHTTLYGTINAPLYVYENGEKKLNITDYAIKEFQNKYKDKATAENIFAYSHAVLSSPKYQKEYEENLKIDYPRIPLYKNFDRFVELGKRLIKLQTEFENFDCRNEEIQLKIEKDFKYMPEDFSTVAILSSKGFSCSFLILSTSVWRACIFSSLDLSTPLAKAASNSAFLELSAL